MRPGGRPASELRGSPGPLSLGPRPFYVGLAGPLLPRPRACCVSSACRLQAVARAARPFLGVLRALYPRAPRQEPPGPNFTLCEWPGLPKQVTTKGGASHYRDGLSPSSGGQHLTSECGQGLPLRPQGGSCLPPPAPRAPGAHGPSRLCLNHLLASGSPCLFPLPSLLRTLSLHLGPTWIQKDIISRSWTLSHLQSPFSR